MRDALGLASPRFDQYDVLASTNFTLLLSRFPTTTFSNHDSKYPAIMAALLPDDLLHMICHQLWEQRDFDTLYHCARAGKQLAVPALASIYRYTVFRASIDC